MHPSTRATCLAFKIHGEETVYFLNYHLANKPWADLPEKLTKLWSRLIDEGYEFSAHNSFFERCIYENVLVARLGWPQIPQSRRRCTAAKAAACALPRNLADAGAAVNLSVQKDKRGHAAMMATCKPTRLHGEFKRMVREISDRLNQGRKLTPKQLKWQADKSKFDEPKKFLTPEDAPDVYEVLYRYCKYDVLTEEALDDLLPDLSPIELEVWQLNQKLNWRGLTVDIPTVKKIVDLLTIETLEKLVQLDTVTMGMVTKPGSRRSILEFLALDGIELPDIKAQTVSDALKSGKLGPEMQYLLELRRALSKTSTKKYQGFLDRSHTDGKVRDILMYHGASTGRDTGTGIQPHNFPRGLIKVTKERPYAAVENVIECDRETLQAIYGDSLSVLFSGILRNMIVAAPGKELFVADFSKIEVAVLWWLAGNEAGLAALRAGKDPYIYQAAANLGKTYEEVETAINKEETWAVDARQLGKAQVLGCGFGMGWRKFKTTAYDVYRLTLSAGQAKSAVNGYRGANSAVPELWKAYEEAALNAVKEPGKVFRAGKCNFKVISLKNGMPFLVVTLPSGRKLYYAQPDVQFRMREIEVTEYFINGMWVSDVPEDFEEIDLERLDNRNEIRVSTKHIGPFETLEFWGVNSKTKKWALERTWGGTITENVVQAVARDLMMYSMVRLEKSKYEALLMVHDEAICQRKVGRGSVEEFVKIICETPTWGEGLPLEAKGWTGPRYRK